jgi:hypothetical protein
MLPPDMLLFGYKKKSTARYGGIPYVPPYMYCWGHFSTNGRSIQVKKTNSTLKFFCVLPNPEITVF